LEKLKELTFEEDFAEDVFEETDPASEEDSDDWEWI